MNMQPHQDIQKILEQKFKAHQQFFETNNHTSVNFRKEQLEKLRIMIKSNEQAIVDAINKDFRHRSEHETYIADIIPSLHGIQYIKKNLKKWMRQSPRIVEFFMQPATAKVIHQPLGTIGVMVPWNYPLFLAIGPLSYAMAAGNNVILKMSEFTPHFSELFQDLIQQTFDEDYITVVNGDSEISKAFVGMNFDHFVFTGSTETGKKIMETSSKNLTPVTLELGGKSPAIIGEKYSIDEAVNRICFGKSFNSGQTCVSPDYTLVPEGKVEMFIESYKKTFNKLYPDFENNNDYTSLISEQHRIRMHALLEDAKSKGAVVHEMADTEKNFYKMAPRLVTGITSDMKISYEEIFGPILPVIGYQSVEDMKAEVAVRKNPLAIYLFSNDKRKHQYFEHLTHSGGLCINDTLMHVAVDDMPFGGVGHSGMGHYHGYEGFLNFSKSKGIFHKKSTITSKVLNPPYNNLMIKTLYKILT